VVTLTFDDGTADQMTVLSILQAQGLKGTFFINSGTIGLPGYLTLGNLQSIAAAGNEIGGHTVTHPDLATLPADEVARQICDDRAQLTLWGFPMRDFAYPFASTTNAVEAAVQACGYNSARMLGDIQSQVGCTGCGFAETIPPADPYYTKALDEFDPSWTLQNLENAVTNAERRGGWLQFTFHTICGTGSCDSLAISPTLLTQFTSWLAARTSRGTVVKTVADVIGGTVKPVVTGPVANPPVTGSSSVTNAGLETTAAGLPSCWWNATYGTNSPAFSLVSPGHTGSVADRIVMSGYSSGDAKLLPVFDLGSCAPTVTPARSYSLRTWYTSDVVTQFAVYLRTTQGGWQYWTSSPWFGPASQWTQAEWTTPAIPAGYNGISFGLSIFSNGTLTTDDYELYDSVGAPPVAPAPAVVAAPFAAAAPDVATDAVTAPGDTSGTDPSGTDPAPADPSSLDPSGTPPPSPSPTDPSTPVDSPPAEPPASTPADPSTDPSTSTPASPPAPSVPASTPPDDSSSSVATPESTPPA
jgi:hypothetical protein